MDKDKNNIMVFENERFGSIRTLLKDGQLWFAAVDVCRAAEIRNSRDAVNRLEEDEKSFGLLDTPGGEQNLRIINESGLYSLMLSSRKPEAKAFKRWVTHEVIPSIRKTGAYMTDAVMEQLYENPDLIVEYLNRLRMESAHSKSLDRKLRTVTRALEKAKPKEAYYNAYISNDDMLCFRYTAKELGVPEKKLIAYLLEKKFLYRDVHRENRVFPRAGKRNSKFFKVRDFHTKCGYCGQYTLLTVEGRNYLLKHIDKITAYKPPVREKKPAAAEICPNEIASA